MQIDGETMETVTDIIYLGSKITPEGDCSHEIKRHLLCGRKAFRAFPGGSESKGSASKTGHVGLIPGSRRPPREGNGNLLQYSYLENSMNRGAWQTTVHRVAESDITEAT